MQNHLTLWSLVGFYVYPSLDHRCAEVCQWTVFTPCEPRGAIGSWTLGVWFFSLFISVIQALGEHLKLRQQVIATATVYFKRFYARWATVVDMVGGCCWYMDWLKQITVKSMDIVSSLQMWSDQNEPQHGVDLTKSGQTWPILCYVFLKSTNCAESCVWRLSFWRILASFLHNGGARCRTLLPFYRRCCDTSLWPLTPVSAGTLLRALTLCSWLLPVCSLHQKLR